MPDNKGNDDYSGGGVSGYGTSRGSSASCVGLKCEYGSVCNSSIGGGCRCPENCLDYPQVREYFDSASPGLPVAQAQVLFNDEDPFCGTDGRDYKNLCELHRTRCEKRTNVQVKFKGKCGEFKLNKI